jgi:Family of unknown function (DUF6586)
LREIKDQVNAYLFSAQTLVKVAHDNSGSKSSVRATNVGACLCLKQAWECWLIELAGYLSVEPFDIDMKSNALAEKLPDYQYLKELMQQEGSWYKELRFYCDEALTAFERENDRLVEPSSELLINAVVLDAEPKKMSLLEVIQSLKSYIQQTRAQQTEW